MLQCEKLGSRYIGRLECLSMEEELYKVGTSEMVE